MTPTKILLLLKTLGHEVRMTHVLVGRDSAIARMENKLVNVTQDSDIPANNALIQALAEALEERLSKEEQDRFVAAQVAARMEDISGAA